MALSIVPKVDAMSALKHGLQLYARHVKMSWASLFISAMNVVDKTASKYIFKFVTHKNKILFH